jgi:hypothetical protein
VKLGNRFSILREALNIGGIAGASHTIGATEGALGTEIAGGVGPTGNTGVITGGAKPPAAIPS